MIHPLLNSDSQSHYDHGDRPAIALLEERVTVTDQIGWCKGNIFKYDYRATRKLCYESDIKKKQTFEAYLDLLVSLPLEYMFERVSVAFAKSGVEVEYEL